MPHTKLILYTAFALLAFAGNSLLCRLALASTSIDPASFTTVRLISGALALWLLVIISRAAAKQPSRSVKADNISAVALFVYAAGFSFAYVSLPTGTGALILFGSVQVTMIGFALWRGERFSTLQTLGFLAAMLGLVYLLMPGAFAPSLSGAALMLLSGMAWGVYSLRGRGSVLPLQSTLRNFTGAVPFAVVLSLLGVSASTIDTTGFTYAVLSGVVTSGLGYAVWYTVLPHLRATSAATLQLSVPVIATLLGVFTLNEQLSLRLVLASLLILGGIALTLKRTSAPQS
ncbi:DMT family transporter [Aliidiomarina celeris]|uniref:DMT family transporter n=1 Tax=Aliidiomarina celeris TaxID=2249428 RepID=UPI000DE869F7|nr:DMT family transporter [Aliidiomarina celeris]